MIRAGSCISAACICQILNFPSILHFTVRLFVQGHWRACRQTHSSPPSFSYTKSTIDTDALDQGPVNSFTVFLSAAQCSHGSIKSDEYECRFDFSTHLYLLAESCSRPSAVPSFYAPHSIHRWWRYVLVSCVVQILGGWLCHLLSQQAWLRHTVCVLVCHLISACLETFTAF